MTIDDAKSIYVGGIRYDCTEADLRRAFELFGSIIAVKIVNDQRSAGKCYAFVTFRNPRSVCDAIHGMNGKMVGGRIWTVNEVRSSVAGVRSNCGSENFRQNQRGMIMDRGRGRERDHKEHERGRCRDRSRSRERGYELARGEKLVKGRSCDRDEDETRDTELSGRGCSRNHDLEFDQEGHNNRGDNHDRKMEKARQVSQANFDAHSRGTRNDKHQSSNKSHRSSSDDQRSRELLTESSDYHHQAEGKVDSLNQRCENLIMEKSEMEQRLNEKNRLISDLRRRSLKLEDTLKSAKKVFSLHQTQLAKLCECFLQVKDCGERLKSFEHELEVVLEGQWQQGYMSVTAVGATNIGSIDFKSRNGA